VGVLSNPLAARSQNDFMLKLLNLGLLLLGSVGALAQRPPALDVFTNPDGAFQFSYPDNYELLVGERILKATQGRHLGYPVCDFSTALVCVIYPIERLDSTKFEAAGFSVNAVPGVTAESDCLGYTDRFARPNDEHSQPSSFSISGRVFRHVSTKRTTAGHAQSSDLYRTFQKDRCYELRIAVSLSCESTAQPPSSCKFPEDAIADSTRQPLILILSSVIFR
jgi:hypothetical protein